MRQIVLDTETTGLATAQGHRIIEIGGVEMVNRQLTGRHYHQYINPERDIDVGASEIHGITSDQLQDKPTFPQVADEFLAFVDGAGLIIHNAPFDLGFINAELERLPEPPPPLEQGREVIDTLLLAKRLHPGSSSNKLDALCKRYHIDNSRRTLHGALLDAELLAAVYLAMTGGQTALSLAAEDGPAVAAVGKLAADRPRLRVVRATDAEREAHAAYLSNMDGALWRD